MGFLCGVACEFPPNACRGERRGVWGRPAPIRSVRLSSGILVWSLIAKRAVRATFIVFDTPAFQDNARLLQIAEEFAVEAFIAKLVVEALNMTVLLRASRLDVERLDRLGLQPVLDAGGDKLRTIVAAQVFGHSLAGALAASTTVTTSTARIDHAG